MKGSGTIMDVSFYPQKFPKDLLFTYQKIKEDLL